MSSLGAVLVIDDDEPTCDLIREILTDEGYEVRTADSALGGMVALADSQPNLILCDYHLPASDGIGFARAVRSIGIDVPIVLMTVDLHAPSNLLDVDFCLL